MIVWSRGRHQKGMSYTRIWERECGGWEYYHIAFRHDPSHEYSFLPKRFLSDRHVITLRMQFMRSAVTLPMEDALSTCLNLWNYECIFCLPMEYTLDWEKTRFYMKLFVFACTFVSEESSRVFTCFHPSRWTYMDKTIAQEHILNVFEQTLEQKEPMDCVTRALPSEEWKEKRLPPLEEGERKTTFVLGPISLKEIFRWKRSERRHINPEGGNLSKDDELVFVARVRKHTHFYSRRAQG